MSAIKFLTPKATAAGIATNLLLVGGFGRRAAVADAHVVGAEAGKRVGDR